MEAKENIIFIRQEIDIEITENTQRKFAFKYSYKGNANGASTAMCFENKVEFLEFAKIIEGVKKKLEKTV